MKTKSLVILALLGQITAIQLKQRSQQPGESVYADDYENIGEFSGTVGFV